MTHAFVHGNPETDAIWGPLVEQLAARGVDDVVLLSPPGFGAPTPPGWDATATSYGAWLAGELERLGGGVHVVGHDWGAGHVYGVLAARPDLVASWAADCAGLLHPDYVWHDAAQGWQTPDVGEQMVAGMVGASDDDKRALLGGLGITGAAADSLAAAMDAEMGRCILALYRSAAQPAMRELGARLEAGPHRPGLVIVAPEDHYAGTAEMAADTARRTGARVATMPATCGHWWMLQDPAAGAEALASFWATL
jgi:pimeloyl-ACP methyl ester carboxylesterase